jgi:hypothetical protein
VLHVAEPVVVVVEVVLPTEHHVLLGVGEAAQLSESWVARKASAAAIVRVQPSAGGLHVTSTSTCSLASPVDPVSFVRKTAVLSIVRGPHSE